MRRESHIPSEEVTEPVVAARRICDRIHGRAEHTNLQIEVRIFRYAIGSQMVNDARNHRHRDHDAELEQKNMSTLKVGELITARRRVAGDVGESNRTLGDTKFMAQCAK